MPIDAKEQSKGKQEKEAMQQVRFSVDPFPRLPADKVVSLMIAYIGFKDEVKPLLMSLSHSTQIYYSSQKSTDLLEWNPKMTEIIEFGQKTHNWDDINYHFEKLPKKQPISLSSINYKVTGGRLCGLQLIFTNDVQTPLFVGSKGTDEYIEPLQVDPKKSIR